MHAIVGLPAHRQSLGEEIANSISHAIGLLAAMVAAPFLIGNAVQGGPLEVTGASVFVGTVLLLYLTSTLYHALRHNLAKRVFRLLDHGAIYLLIAGTYTPFTLGVLRGPWGWSLLAAVWILAVCGVALRVIARSPHPRASVGLYLAMGWMIVVAVRPLWLRMPLEGLIWLAAGGVAYTVGVVFYTTDHRIRYGHLIWHLFVLTGTACHFVAVMNYAG